MTGDKDFELHHMVASIPQMYSALNLFLYVVFICSYRT
jgi:hypothetical protein